MATLSQRLWKAGRLRLTTNTTEQLQRKQRSDKTGNKRLIAARTKQFIAWDGEGFNRDDGSHQYCLFGNSLGKHVTGDLSWRQCFKLLFQAPNNAHHVIFAGTYDVIMMFQHDRKVAWLLKGHTIRVGSYRVRFLRGKFLHIYNRDTKQSRTLYDVFTFYACSFVKACRQYLGDSQLLDDIERMKLARNTFTPDMLADGSIGQYMTQELQMLVALCDRLRSMLAAVDIYPAKWHGPGAVASKVLQTHKIARHKGDYGDEFRRIAESAYYGGRFEQFKRGRANQPVYQYDIRSAYPNAMRHLPSLANVTWSMIDTPTHVADTDLCYIDYQPKRIDHMAIGWLPHRIPNGSIYYPNWAIGWYWGVEIPRHLHRYVTKLYRPSTLVGTPFDFVTEQYEHRAALKRAGKPEQLALKLSLNSLYGKLAQSKGAICDNGRWQYPSFHEVVWSGYITAYTRAMISKALHSVDPQHIVATETDSIFSLVPLSLEIGERLGQWESDTLEDIIYLQSGVSITKRGGQWKHKSRGFTLMRDQGIDTWLDILKQPNPTMEIKQTRFGTDPRRQTFARWTVETRTMRLSESLVEKRIHLPQCPQCEYGSMAECLHHLIIPNIPIRPTTPYQFPWHTTQTPTIYHDTETDLILEWEHTI